jgi:CHAT domain-containing protein
LNKLSRLTASEDEAASIAEVLGSPKSDILTGFSATRERVFAPELLNYKILHFATHGLINEDRPELSSIALSQFDDKGQNLDGLLRLQDIYSLNLKSDLVVLSACETGIGKEVKGQGLMSLNNAFLQVGAKSVLSSLWKVDDQATKELMKNFYQELATEKFTTTESLRQAQIRMFKNPQFKSPFFWAAFTVQGDYKNIPKFSANNSKYWLYLLLLIPILFFGYWVKKFIQPRKSK